MPSHIEEHRDLLAAEGRKAGPSKKARLAGDCEQFLNPARTGPLLAKLDQLRSNPAFLKVGVHRQTPYLRHPFGIDLKSTTADDPVTRGGHQK